MTTALPSQPFGQSPAGRDAKLYTLENDRLRVRMVSIEAPGRHGPYPYRKSLVGTLIPFTTR
jgi:hypothetical protein